MQHKFDQIRIEHIRLHIDHKRRQFVNVSYPDNVIPFPDKAAMEAYWKLTVEISSGNIFLLNPEDPRPYINSYEVILPSSVMNRRIMKDDAYMQQINTLAHEGQMGFRFVSFAQITEQNHIDAQLKVFLDGHPFRVDPDWRVLVDIQHPSKSYSFDLLTWEDNFVTGWYHKLDKSIVAQKHPSGEESSYLPIVLPKQAFEKLYMRDPELGDIFNRYSYKLGLRCQVESDEIAKRLKGELPELDVLETMFLVNGKKQMLIEKDNPAHTLQLSGSGMETWQRLFYHVKTKKFLTPQQAASAKPKDIFEIRLQPWNQLDPVGASEYQNMGRYALMARYSVNEYINTIGLPLSLSDSLQELKNMSQTDKKPPQGENISAKNKKKGLKP